MTSLASARGSLGEIGRALSTLRWVQGPGGNVSVKSDGWLLVKASGKRLADAGEEGGHAVVSLERVRQALDGDAAADAEVFATQPRPSLEAYFHAIGAPYVAHTHAVGALLHACASDTAENDLGGRVRQILYVTPGRGVAEAVRVALGDAVDGSSEAAVVLRSHGLVVYAGSPASAVQRTHEIDAAARARFDDLPPVEDQLAALTAEEELILLGDDGGAVGFARPLPPRVHVGYLFPDVVVCASALEVDELPAREGRVPLVSRAVATFGRGGVLTDARGQRCAFARTRQQLTQLLEVLAAHQWVEDALAPRGLCRYLPADEPATLLGLPSEQYRIRLNAQ